MVKANEIVHEFENGLSFVCRSDRSMEDDHALFVMIEKEDVTREKNEIGLKQTGSDNGGMVLFS